MRNAAFAAYLCWWWASLIVRGYTRFKLFSWIGGD